MALTACVFALLGGVLQQLPRIVVGTADVAPLSRLAQEQAVSLVHGVQDIGHLAGRLALPLLVIVILGRARLLRLLVIPAAIVLPAFLLAAVDLGLAAVAAGAALVLFLAMSLQSFLGVYLPQLFPLHLRGTGEGFAYGVGARILGMSAAFAAPQLANFTPGETPAAKLASAAALIAVLALAGLLALSFRLPSAAAEPSQ
jgi:hypothetical protein